ncbi:hypothetical protein LX99_01877 [Mucilaginibacter oryzae]|uniref:Uncharacterized protein n=1 Tax=Mucilaginibacter oryzae TaxID=468058 RepID=A0A316HCA3_9SPHI|nr:hypothetical protein LX99_01877 [Mucilaginibacter oryzae]
MFCKLLIFSSFHDFPFMLLFNMNGKLTVIAPLFQYRRKGPLFSRLAIRLSSLPNLIVRLASEICNPYSKISFPFHR